MNASRSKKEHIFIHRGGIVNLSHQLNRLHGSNPIAKMKAVSSGGYVTVSQESKND